MRDDHKESARTLRTNARTFVVFAKRELRHDNPDCRMVNEHLIHALAAGSVGAREEHYAAQTPEGKKAVEEELRQEGQDLYQTWQEFFGRCCMKGRTSDPGRSSRQRSRWRARKSRRPTVPPNRGKDLYVALFRDLLFGA
jgi:hypothetical protein